MALVPSILMSPTEAQPFDAFTLNADVDLFLILTLIPLSQQVESHQSRQLRVEIDKGGFLNIDRLKGDNGRKINLRRDAKFEELNSASDLHGKYMMEIKVVKKNQCEEVEIEQLVMIRYVIFQIFDQHVYPLIYVTVLRRLIGAVLARKRVQLENKLSRSQAEPIYLEREENMLTEDQLIELESMYDCLKKQKLNSFPLIAKKHSKLVNEVLSRSKFTDFIKRSFIITEFQDRIVQLLSIFNYADLKPEGNLDHKQGGTLPIRQSSPPRSANKRQNLQSAKPGKVREHLMHNLGTPSHHIREELSQVHDNGRNMMFQEAGRKLREMQKQLGMSNRIQLITRGQILNTPLRHKLANPQQSSQKHSRQLSQDKPQQIQPDLGQRGGRRIAISRHIKNRNKESKDFNLHENSLQAWGEEDMDEMAPQHFSPYEVPIMMKNRLNDLEVLPMLSANLLPDTFRYQASSSPEPIVIFQEFKQDDSLAIVLNPDDTLAPKRDSTGSCSREFLSPQNADLNQESSIKRVKKTSSKKKLLSDSETSIITHLKRQSTKRRDTQQKSQK
ncbi:hypothetical protein FGO68_gene13402 [Halteria grandinella]|uniref:Uncharacterized protein n=1 Tax=Halteria grandinella TaxID=5974 RepID=A0A8J8NEJ3_HALGN|nr:hypothetical protein FGO68_gene13402 [Halteria grandinella]